MTMQYCLLPLNSLYFTPRKFNLNVAPIVLTRNVFGYLAIALDVVVVLAPMFKC